MSNFHRVEFNVHMTRGDVYEAVVDMDEFATYSGNGRANDMLDYLQNNGIPYKVTPGELTLENAADLESYETWDGDSLDPEEITSDGLPKEFLDKRQSLAMFLLALATGQTWEDAEGVDNFHENYTKDADEVLRSQPHLLGLETRELMGIE